MRLALVKRAADAPVEGRPSHATAAMLTAAGAAAGAGVGARKGSQVGFGQRLGTRLKGLGFQWKSRSAQGGTNRALLRRAGRLMTSSPRAYHALHGAGQGALLGGAVGLGAGAVAEMLQKESSMRYVLVKKDNGHCPPKTKKKILIKHHEKDLDEAVEEGNKDYARHTVKDIEEISEGKHAEQYADELDMVEGIEPQFLREAPIATLEVPPLPYLSPKLAYDRDGLKISVKADIVESMMKIAAKGPAFAKLGPGEIEEWTRTVRVDPAAAAAQNMARATAEHANAPIRTFGESAQAAGKNLWGGVKSVLMGEGKTTKAQGAQALLAGGLLLGAGLGIRQIYKRRQVQQQYDRVLGAVMEDPTFKNVEQKEDKVPEAYSFLRRYAPTLAMDPVIARSFVRQAIESDVSWMNQTVAQGLAEAESKHLDANRARKDLRDLMSHPLVAPFAGKGGGGGSEQK